VYRDRRYVVDLRHPLQAPCEGNGSSSRVREDIYPRVEAVGIVWSAVRLQVKSLWRVIRVCANVSGLFVELPLLAIMESARRCPTKWVELQRVLIPTQA